MAINEYVNRTLFGGFVRCPSCKAGLDTALVGLEDEMQVCPCCGWEEGDGWEGADAWKRVEMVKRPYS